MKSYLDMRHDASIIRDTGNYNLANCEMNPAIFENFVGLLFAKGLPAIVWEPFAGCVSHSSLCDFAEDVGATLLAQTLNPRDSRILAADSTVVGPDRTIGGMLFHPPYFASSVTGDNRDVAKNRDQDKYMRNLQAVATRADVRMAHNGLVCAVGRDYRIQGKRIRMDKMLLELFQGRGYILEDVWSSEPDIVLIIRRKI